MKKNVWYKKFLRVKNFTLDKIGAKLKTFQTYDKNQKQEESKIEFLRKFYGMLSSGYANYALKLQAISILLH